MTYWCHLHRRVACGCHAPQSPMNTGGDCGAQCMGKGAPCVLYRGHHLAHVDADHCTWAQSREERGLSPHPLVAAVADDDADALHRECDRTRDALVAVSRELRNVAAERDAARRELAAARAWARRWHAVARGWRHLVGSDRRAHRTHVARLAAALRAIAATPHERRWDTPTLRLVCEASCRACAAGRAVGDEGGENG